MMWKHFYYGVCYYPEHWAMDRHASDIQRMADCGFNIVRLGEGAWNYWEPAEGKFQFELFDRTIALCRQHGMKVILGTPTYAAPAWVSHQYPEVLRWNFERIPMAHGSRRNLNYTSPKYLELSDRLCTALAQHYQNEPTVIGWQLDNEFNCHMDVSYAPTDSAAFRKWLREKYQTLDHLNAAWGTSFWSQTYSDWQQVDLPAPTATWKNPSQLLDETRFISDCVIRFAARQAAILRKANANWQITHNGLFPNIDGPKLVKQLDFFSHDQYPLFWDGNWPGYAAPLQQARSLSFPFAVLEQQSGPGGQMGYLQRTPQPGELRLWGWQSIGHGAKLLSFFRWRTCPFGSEQHWHGILDADDRDNRRLAEVKGLDREIQAIPPEFFDTPVIKAIAVLRDFDNEANDRRINTYTQAGTGEGWILMAEVLHRHLPGDFVWPDTDFAGYKFIFVPHLKIVSAKLVEKLKAFAHTGGTVLLTAQSGSKDKNCHMVEAVLPGLFRELAGVEIEDWTTLKPAESREVQLGEAKFELGTFVEKLNPIDSQILGTWTLGDGVLNKGPAITRRRVGKGSVFYVGGYVTPGAAKELLSYMMAETGLKPLVNCSADVEAIERRSASAHFLMLLNHGSTQQRITNIPAGDELLNNQAIYNGELLLEAYGVAIVKLR